MNEKALSTFALSLKNIIRRPFRSLGLICAVAIVSFIIFSGGIFLFSLRNGLVSMKSRLGADLMIVPLGYDKGLEGILLRGEPSYFYLDKEIENQIKGIPGVEKVSAQFFLVSLNQDCCAIPVQFIGFNPDTDFSVQPWISESYIGQIKDGELVVGNDITIGEDKKLKVFNRYYTIAAKLEKTGSGLDQAVYANMTTLARIFDSAKASGLTFTKDINPKNSVSSILVKIKEGYTQEEVTHNIRAKLNGLQVIKTKGMISGIAKTLGTFKNFLFTFTAAFFVAVMILLATIFSITANERKKEFAILRSLGASGKKLSSIVLTEAFLISAAASAIGTILSVIITLPYAASIGRELHLPSLRPNIFFTLLIAAISFALSLLTGPLASLHTAIRISKRETYLTFREGE